MFKLFFDTIKKENVSYKGKYLSDTDWDRIIDISGLIEKSLSGTDETLVDLPSDL